MTGKNKKSDFISTGQVAQNRRAHFDYIIDEVFQAGLVLTGTEQGEIYISNMFIAEYANKGYESHVERRNRKLLLQHKEIIKIQNALSRKGATLIAMKLYFDNHGRAKLEIGLGRGKKLYDKRETAKERDWNREKSRLLSH